MTAASRLQLHIHRDRTGSTVIEADGEIDMATAPRLREELLTAVKNAVTVLDASSVSFCDSTGLRVLAEAHHAARELRTSLRLAAPSPAVMRVLALAGCLSVFHIYPDTDTALEDRADPR